jgi:hypothetical protein
VKHARFAGDMRYTLLMMDSRELGEMLGRPLGIMLLAAGLLAAGLAGIAALWAAWPRTSNTSPLAVLFAVAWSCAYIVAGVLTWRRSRFAATAFIAAIGLLMFPLSFLFPGGGDLFLLPSFVVIFFFTFLGYRYLRRKCEPAA